MAAALIWCAIMASPVLAWLVFRSSGYKRQPDARPTGPGWERTDERFVDPTSGEVLVVWHHPRTGERAYVRAA